MRIEIESLAKRYGDRVVLDGLSLTVESGEFLALLGPSGAGKSTLLLTLAGLLLPDGGRIRLGDRIANDPALRLPPSRRGIGMVFQGLALWPHMTVLQHLRFAAPSTDPAELLQRLELSDRAGALPQELSGGEAQRLALARALIGRPSILLFDEPLGPLDRRLKEKMIDLIVSVQRANRITTIYVTHDYEEALRCGDRVAVLLDGKIAQVGTPEEVYRRPASRAVAELTGPASFLPGPDGSTVVLRPDQIALEAAAGDGAAVVGVRFAGSRWRVTLDLGGHRVEADADVKPAIGERFRLRWPPDAVRV